MPVKKSGNGKGPANKRMKGMTMPEVAVPQEATRGKMQGVLRGARFVCSRGPEVTFMIDN